jgi:hypothetical protein
MIYNSRRSNLLLIIFIFGSINHASYFVLFTKYYEGDGSKEGEKGRMCSMRERHKK